MYGIVGEDQSDADMLKVIVRRLARLPDCVPIPAMGCNGSKLLTDGPGIVRLLVGLGCDRLIICYDADSPDPLRGRLESGCFPTRASKQQLVLVPILVFQ